MKYICLGYIDLNKFMGFTEDQRNSFIDECCAYDEELQRNGNWAGGEGLQPSENAVTLRWAGDRIAITDGPYAETKEQIGGILMLEATDLNHAIQIMSKHPGVRLGGPFEIRPAADLSGMVKESQVRRSRAGSC